MDCFDELANLFESADGDLFKPKEKKKAVTSNDRLVEGFGLISAFVEKNGRVPDKDSDDIAEMTLGAQLSALRSDKDKIERLKEYDEFGLLEVDQAPESLDELFTNDGDLFSVDKALFDIDTLPNKGRLEKNTGDVAQRAPVKSFSQYKKLFADKQNELKAGISKLVRFRTITELKLHGFYIADGMMCYVEHIGEQKEVFGRQKERLRVIFENGTESNMYLRTLSSELYRNGYIVADSTEEVVDNEAASGCIYVLKSLSEDPAITTIKDLYKIGVTTDTVEKRIANAEKDPTYLMACVDIVATYKLTGDYQPIKVESLIHRIFADAKVDMEIMDGSGLPYTPDEWYSVPIEVIEEAIGRVADKSIVNFVYNPKAQILEEKR